MTEQDKEGSAILAVVSALATLDEQACLRVLEYASKRFAPSSFIPVARIAEDMSPNEIRQEPLGIHNSVPRTDIKSLKEEKQPANGIQMAVLVAYYLKEVCPEAERKDSIGAVDIAKYFNQARFPLPKR
jgi:hypothetical protein